MFTRFANNQIYMQLINIHLHKLTTVLYILLRTFVNLFIHISLVASKIDDACQRE